MNWREYLELTKPRLTFLALLMAFVGMILNSLESVWALQNLWALLGIALVGGACGIWNQVFERASDAQMRRTQKRPLVTGTVSVQGAMIWGAITAAVGLGLLLWKTNLLCTGLAVATLVSYLGVYTPMKKVTSLSTIFGALPGALPALMGAAAVGEVINTESWLLFWIIFLWQIPHFLAIAWIYRDDYARGGFKVLPLEDPAGRVTFEQIFLYTFILLVVTLLPFLFQITGFWYLGGALICGLIFLWQSFRLISTKTHKEARTLFFISILYLPVLGFLLVWDR